MQFYLSLSFLTRIHFNQLIHLFCQKQNVRTRDNSLFLIFEGSAQGYMLSPLLFNIYVNEITTMFQNTDSDPFKLPNRTKLNCLMYADDLIILPKTKLGLQNWCNKL